MAHPQTTKESLIADTQALRMSIDAKKAAIKTHRTAIEVHVAAIHAHFAAVEASSAAGNTLQTSFAKHTAAIKRHEAGVQAHEALIEADVEAMETAAASLQDRVVAFEAGHRMHRHRASLINRSTQSRTMKYWIQVLGAHSEDAKPSLMFHFDSQRYLFNCGEGTQRFATEHSIRLMKMHNIFLTRLDWECVGGIPGMLLTLGDVGLKQVNIHGPENTTHFLASTRHFIYRSSVALEAHEPCVDGTQYQDENVRIQATPLRPGRANEAALAELSVASDADASPQSDAEPAVVLDMAANTTGRKRKPSGERSPTRDDRATKKQILQQMFGSVRHNAGKKGAGCFDEKAAVETGSQQSFPTRLKGGRPNPATVCYIVTGPDVRGKFDLNAAKALGLQPGPLFGQLQRGQSVKTPDGTVVEPSQVMSPTRPGSVFIVIDVPDLSYVDAALHNETLARYCVGDGAEALSGRVQCVFHMLGAGVLAAPDYQRFMQRMHPGVQHIVFSPDHCAQQIVFTSSGTSQAYMNNLDRAVFPLLHHDATEAPLPDLRVEATIARPLLSWQVEPQAKFIEDSFWPYSYEKATQRVANKLVRYQAAVAEAHELLKGKTLPSEPDNTQYAVATLGTGSAIPSKYRNVSSTVVSTPKGSIVLDCGEGTFGQLYRLFGTSQTTESATLMRQRCPDLDAFLTSLKLIFISHMHADHHLGLVRILGACNRLRQQRSVESPLEKLVLIAPARMYHFLSEYDTIVPIGLRDNVEFINCESLLFAPRLHGHAWQEREHTQWEDTYARICRTLDLQSIKTADVIHCPWSYAVVIEGSESVAFSGDTRPCDRFVEAAQGCDLLIHEATLEDSMTAEALAKRHCTTGEAVDVFERMRAKKLLLTHFSQRYPRMPNIRHANHPENIAIGFDFLTFGTKTEFPKLPLYVKALSVLCQAQEVEEIAHEAELAQQDEEAEKQEKASSATLKKAAKPQQQQQQQQSKSRQASKSA
ncbi:hypothetical protein RI367_005918 [Sorochytrium milnesiophthora]